MSREVDWYGVLGVATDASREEIVHAYRRLAHALHPDTRPDDPDATGRFREVTAAYEVLTDPARRARYDRTRTGRQWSGRRPGQSASDWLVTRPRARVEPFVSRFGSVSDPLVRVGPVCVSAPATDTPSWPRAAGGRDELREVARCFFAWLGDPWGW